MTKIVKATAEDLDKIAPLFDGYRVFYQQASDLSAARSFLSDRIKNNESVLFLALNEEEPIGFAQLFPSFSSVSMMPLFILNDLFVIPSYRNKGIGKALLHKAKQFCKEKNYKGLALETAIDNPAQQLYEQMGWVKDVHCFHYFWTA